MIAVRVLGPMEVTADGVPVSLGGPRQRCVLARLSASLARWRGVAFEEFSGLPWADLEASRLAELRLTALETRADAALRLGHAAQIIADLERLAAEQPLREEGWRLLALALYQSGRQGDALAALRRVRELLAAELGVDPGPALRGLERDILAQESRLTAEVIEPGVGGGAVAEAQARPGAEPTATKMPDGDREAVRRQLADLPDAARSLLLRASVIGTEADAGVLADIADAEEDVLLDAIDSALAAGLITEPAPGRIRFADQRVRDALYGSLSRLRSMLMAASCGIADFRAADWHAAEAERIATRYRLPTIESAVGMYRAMRTALNGDPSAAAERYRDVARQLSGFGLRLHGAAVGAAATVALLITQDRTAELAGEAAVASMFPEAHALGLAAAGQVAEARAVAGQPVPVTHDRAWLFQISIRGLLGIAIDDRERAASAYRALLPCAGQPAGAESILVTLWPVAQILGDLARYLGLPGADAHYQEALAIGQRADVRSWCDAATRRLG